MNCKLCGNNSRVLHTDGNTAFVKRRRECLCCRHRFTTVEIDDSTHNALMASDEIVQKTVQMVAEAKGLASGLAGPS